MAGLRPAGPGKPGPYEAHPPAPHFHSSWCAHRALDVSGGTFYGGYAGYFRDPDGHLWEVVWNPVSLPSE